MKKILKHVFVFIVLIPSAQGNADLGLNHTEVNVLTLSGFGIGITGSVALAYLSYHYNKNKNKPPRFYADSRSTEKMLRKNMAMVEKARRAQSGNTGKGLPLNEFLEDFLAMRSFDDLEETTAILRSTSSGSTSSTRTQQIFRTRLNLPSVVGTMTGIQLIYTPHTNLQITNWTTRCTDTL